ncbi:NACHT domain-containing protein [Funiculus sociatus GB2-A5]|uniref:NACHT domain-containing protein n=1 Tax=Funiculus sociatus GB2-A5 TaxID=2933946 RepID=A0ABV0JS60_9CYAN|nr:NACHT domain-containing protein [Trichocoleus sp. FACHB-6]MBD2063339.1 NACHT domain-containing protein [Trichocoleus sp. FACHB-6]
MPRNIGWREPAKSNAIKLLEALLSLADGWELDDCELKAAVQVEWVSENKLRVTGKVKQKRGKRETTVEIGTTKKALVKLVEKAGKSLEFPQRQQGEGSSREDREAEAVQTVFDCLRELGVFEEDPNNTRKNQGYWKFTLKLKHQTASLKENLAEIQLKWKGQNPEEPPPPPTNINWREVCQTRLDNQKRLLNNPLTCGNQPDFYVPLGLVEPKPKEEIRHRCDVSPEEGSRFYQLSETQITKTYNQPKEFFEEVLRQGQSKNSQGRRLGITGEPGAGKTTLCYQIAKWILKQNLGVPILIRLADIGSKSLGQFLLEDWLCHAADEVEAAPPEWKTAFRELVKSGDVWLLLDGVDEMPVASSLAAINRQLAEGWANKVRVVLTCRLNVWDADKNALRDFDVYRNLDFDEKQVKEFIQNWFADNQECKGLLQELAQPNRERINDLIKNPLRLALLCRTWKKGSKLPDTKAGLYERLVEAHYIWKDENQEFAISPEKQKELNQAFGELAKQAIDNKDFRFRLRETFIKSFLGEPNQEFSLFWWALKLGWLNRVGLPLAQEEDSDRAVYAFFHPTFQEYFAACTISDWHFFLTHDNDNPQPLPGNVYRIFEPQWKEVILLWLGRENVEREPKEEFIKVLLEFEDNCLKPYWGFYQYRAYFLAAAGMTEFESCSRIDEIVRQIVEWTFGFFDIDKQAWMYRGFYPIHKYARAVLWETNRSHVIVVISEWLCLCQEERIRKKVAENNGKQTEEENIKQLALTLLKFSPSNSQATQAINNLVNSSQNDLFKYLKSVKLEFNQLVAYLSNDRQENTEITDTLEKAIPKDIDEIAILINILQSSENDAKVFCETISKLDKIITGNLSALPVVVNIINQSLMEDGEADYYPLFIALECLPKIGAGSLEAINVLKEVLQRNLDYRHYAIKFKAVLALIAIGIGSQDAFNILIKIVHQREKRLYHQTALSLQNILQGDLFRQAVVNLKGYLNNSIYENDRGFYIHCYWTLLYCTQNMTYVDFYQAWCNPISTHPESQETTAVASNSSTQSFDLANFLQLLNTAIANNSNLNDTIHLICIDASKFDNPDNPASEIYAEMVMQGCPERQNGEPETMQALKVYCQLKCQGIFLIFYEDTSGEPPQSFSQTFLSSLSKFRNARRICVVSEQPCNLQTFSPSQPNLVADIVSWIREKMMEE